MSEQSLKYLLTSAQRAYKAGEFTAALESCKKAVRTDEGKECAAVHLTFAAVFTAQEEPEMAERAFGSALKLEPESGQAWKGLASLLEGYGRERAEELLEAYQKLAELAAAGKLKGKAAEWESKLGALQVSLGLCAIDDDETDGAAKLRGGRGARGRGSGAAVNPMINDESEAGAGGSRREGRGSRRGGGGGEGGGGEGGGGEGGGGESGGEGGDDEAGGDAMAAARTELAELRAKVAAGTKLSGKQKRGLKKLEDAEERWKAYEAAEVIEAVVVLVLVLVLVRSRHISKEYENYEPRDTILTTTTTTTTTFTTTNTATATPGRA